MVQGLFEEFISYSVKKLHSFMEPEESVVCSQKPTTGQCPCTLFPYDPFQYYPPTYDPSGSVIEILYQFLWFLKCATCLNKNYSTQFK